MHMTAAHTQHRDVKRRPVHKCCGCSKSFANTSNSKKHTQSGRCKLICEHCLRVMNTLDGMRLNILQHMNHEFLTIPQLRIFRKQLKKIGNANHHHRSGSLAPGRSTAPSPPVRSGLRKRLRKIGKHRHRSSSPVPGLSTATTPPVLRQSFSSSSSSSSSNSSDIDETDIQTNQQRKENFKGKLVTYIIIPTKAEEYDLLQLFSNKRRQIYTNNTDELNRLKSFK